MSTLQCLTTERQLYLFSIPEYGWTGKVMNWRNTMIRATWKEMKDQASIYQDANVYLRGQLIGTVSFGVFSATMV